MLNFFDVRSSYPILRVLRRSGWMRRRAILLSVEEEFLGCTVARTDEGVGGR
jgi:hypothetical protein